jgi:uncharacterized damage-inducible protein DinB
MSMQLIFRVNDLVNQLGDLLYKISDDQYTRPVELIGNASVGQHLRHIIEFYQELINGYEDGQVFYHRRKRDLLLETDKSFALATMEGLAAQLALGEKELLVFYDEEPTGETLAVISSYGRELMYTVDHTVHHMSMIRVAISVVSDHVLPSAFGVAASTLQYQKRANK